MAYQITFNCNGGNLNGTLGTFDCLYGNNENINFGDSIPLPTANQVSKNGYVLIGWSPAQYNEQGETSGTNKKIYSKEYNVCVDVNNTEGAPTSSETLYAVWKNLNPVSGALSVKPLLSRFTQTTQAAANISDLFKSEDIKKKAIANKAMGILDAKRLEKTSINKPCYATFTVPEWGAHDPVKATIQIGNINDINQWKLSEAKNTTEYRENILSEYPEKGDNPSDTTYMIIWSRKGVEVSDTVVLGDGDILIGKAIEKSNVPNYVTAIPMVYNETYNVGIKMHDYNEIDYPYGDWVRDSDDMFTVSDKDGNAATNYGYITITCGKRQISTLNTSDFNLAKLNTTYGDKITLMATPRNNSTFMGWYRRESENNYAIGEGIDLYDSQGYEVDSGEIKDNVTYYTDSAHTTPAVLGEEYWIASTRLGYYKIEESQKFDTRVDSDDLYNQYVAVFENTELEVTTPIKQLPLNMINCFATCIQTGGFTYSTLDDIKTMLYNNKTVYQDYLAYSSNTSFKNIPILTVNTVCGKASITNIDGGGEARNVIISMPVNYNITPVDSDIEMVHCTSVDIPDNKWIGDNLYALTYQDGYEIPPMNIEFNYSVETPIYIYHAFRYSDMLDESVSGDTIHRYNFINGITPTPYDGQEPLSVGSAVDGYCGVIILINDNKEQITVNGDTSNVIVTKIDENAQCVYECEYVFEGELVKNDIVKYFISKGYINPDGSIPKTSPYYEYHGEDGCFYMIEAQKDLTFDISVEISVEAQ